MTGSAGAPFLRILMLVVVFFHVGYELEISNEIVGVAFGYVRVPAGLGYEGGETSGGPGWGEGWYQWNGSRASFVCAAAENGCGCGCGDVTWLDHDMTDQG